MYFHSRCLLTFLRITIDSTHIPMDQCFFSLMERQACNQVFFALARMLSPSYARSMRSAWLQLRAGVKSKHSVLTVSLDANRWILLNGIAKRRYDWREEDLKISPVL